MALVIPEILEKSCATRQALERMAAKWRVLLIYALLAGPQRHSDLRRTVQGITQKVLTETLRGMEAGRAGRATSAQGDRSAARRVRPDHPREDDAGAARGHLCLGDRERSRGARSVTRLSGNIAAQRRT